MAACHSWSSGKAVIARLMAVPSYVTTKFAACRSWSSGKIIISSPSRSDCGRDLITTDGLPSDEDDDKAMLATVTL
ncbi:hypothetical protein TIFTF001_027401 [Ficus carica]|uniref:Uncharacterized protein n=1 Tax=Ficus carica TaxID=3494 RepID=A0AA88DN41_FICCA|nr:hypothetical protein TIFTF001_027401 [Ficus carica]